MERTDPFVTIIDSWEKVMADKMTLYAGDDDIDLEELERALTIVRRKMTDPTSFPGFLENPEVSSMSQGSGGRGKGMGGDSTSLILRIGYTIRVSMGRFSIGECFIAAWSVYRPGRTTA